MPDPLGRIIKGERLSPATEFKKGEHWRPHRIFREKDYLEREYLEKGRSSGEIASEHSVKDTAILFWLKKHKIPVRSMSETRRLKHWDTPSGPGNPMFVDGSAKDRLKDQNGRRMQDIISAVRARDGNLCVRCGADVSGKHKGTTHHKKRWAGNPALRFDPDNIVTLCCKCHGFIHSRRNTQREFLEG